MNPERNPLASMAGVALFRQYGHRIANMQDTTLDHLQTDARTPAQGLTRPWSHQAVEISTGRTQTVKLEQHCTDAHPTVTEGSEGNSLYHQIAPVFSGGKRPSAATLRPAEVLFGNQRHLATIRKFPMPSVRRVAVTSETRTDNRLNLFQRPHLLSGRTGDIDTYQPTFQLVGTPFT